MTKSVVEPVIKRFSVVETRDDPELTTTIYPPSSFNDIDVASVIQTASLEDIDAKKKKTTTKQKTKRKDQQTQQQQVKPAFVENFQKVELISEKRKISIF